MICHYAERRVLFTIMLNVVALFIKCCKVIMKPIFFSTHQTHPTNVKSVQKHSKLAASAQNIKRYQGPYSQHLIFFLSYKWAQKARALHDYRLKRLTSDKHSSLLRAFIRCKDNEVL
jgi:hypothetical protein